MRAVELEVEAFLAERAGLELLDGRARLVRHGHAPERAVQTGIGAVAVARPKVPDCGVGEGGERIRFTSAILPRWARRTRSLDALLPSEMLAAKVWNVLDKVPTSLQGRMKVDLREISAAPTRAAAGKAIAIFAEKYRAKYPKAVECHTKGCNV